MIVFLWRGLLTAEENTTGFAMLDKEKEGVAIIEPGDDWIACTTTPE
jgi:hypothetical protein